MNRKKSLPYYCETHATWFVIYCPNKRIAMREACSEYGRRSVTSVRVATDENIRRYRVQHGTEPETVNE